jgi:hypothetical protein
MRLDQKQGELCCLACDFEQSSSEAKYAAAADYPELQEARAFMRAAGEAYRRFGFDYVESDAAVRRGHTMEPRKKRGGCVRW